MPSSLNDFFDGLMVGHPDFRRKASLRLWEVAADRYQIGVSRSSPDVPATEVRRFRASDGPDTKVTATVLGDFVGRIIRGVE
jgi:hypothetical protein